MQSKEIKTYSQSFGTRIKIYLERDGYFILVLGGALGGAITNSSIGFIVGAFFLCAFFLFNGGLQREEERESSLEAFLDSKKDEIENASQNEYGRFGNKGFEKAPSSVPFGQYYKSTQILYEEITRLKNTEKNNNLVHAWFHVGGLACVAALLSHAYYARYWQLDLNSDVPRVVKVYPTLFGSEKYGYKWATDPNGNTGWIGENNDRSIAGNLRLIEEDGNNP